MRAEPSQVIKSSPQILVVDDEPEIVSILEELLMKRGYLVSTADRGDRALQLIAKNNYSLILADLKMPGLDGFKLVRWMREQAPETAIIVMSGYGLQATGELERMGVMNYIVKPIDFDHLLSLMKELAPPGPCI